MELFQCCDTQRLLCNKYIVVIGDSVQRAIYKDLVLLTQSDDKMCPQMLKRKGEKTHCGDELVEGGMLEDMTNKKSYREVRQYQTNTHLIRFYFVTRCYSEYFESILADINDSEYKPDVMVMNSCLWDITRYGASSLDMYEKNLQIMVQRLSEVLPEDCLFIWHTTMPIAEKIQGGFLIPQIAFMNDILRLDVMVANFYAAQVAADNGFDVLDLHHKFRDQLMLRSKDGVHWNEVAHRRITNYLLSHICEAWGVGIPRRSLMANMPPLIPNRPHPSGRPPVRNHQRSVSDMYSHRYNPSFVNLCQNLLQLGDMADNMGDQTWQTGVNDFRMNQMGQNYVNNNSPQHQHMSSMQNSWNNPRYMPYDVDHRVMRLNHNY